MRNVLTLEAFAEWCESKPADAEYTYWDAGRCACAQYAKTMGLDFQQLLPAAIIKGDWDAFWLKADGLAGEEPYTFSALASRLRSTPTGSAS
jgi:hypothetical protein